MKKGIILLGLVAFFSGFCLTPSQGQDRARNWYFGNQAGLSFETRYPMPVTDGQMNIREGLGSISDTLGNLLCYSDGETVWGPNHGVIASGLTGDQSATMSAYFVPNPINDKQVYLFTTSIIDNTPGAENPGGHFYIIDFSSNPEGELIDNLEGSPLQENSTEKILAIPFGTEKVEETGINGYWIITHEFDNWIFNVFTLTDQIRFVDQFTAGTGHQNEGPDAGNKGAAGYMVASIAGNKIGVAIAGQKMFEVFRFNNNTGQINLQARLPAGDPDHKKEYLHQAYGVAFSPSGRFLYGTSRDKGVLMQWDLELPGTTVEEAYVLRSNSEMPCGALQMAPNGKIYVAVKGVDYVGVINHPDRLGKRSGYQEFGARLIDNETGIGGTGELGLPQFDMSSFEINHFQYSGNCYGDTTRFLMAGGVAGGYSKAATSWSILDPVSGGMYGQVFPDDYITGSFVFPFPGEYDIQVQSRFNGQNLNFIERITIHELPQVNLAEDYTRLCRGDSLILDAGNGAFYEWADESYRERRYTVTEDDFAIGLIQEYRVKVTDYLGCVGWDTIQVEIKAPPKVVFEYKKAVCGEPTGAATVIPGNGVLENYYYRWEDFPDNTSNAIENVIGGEYVVYVKSRFAGCEASFVAVVPELGGAGVEIVSSVPDSVCPGTLLNLTIAGEGASEYRWINPAGFSSQQIAIKADKTTEFEALVISRDEFGNECPTTIRYTLHVFDDKKPEIGVDQNACEGDTLQLMAPDGYASYLWNNGLLGQSIEITESIIDLALVVIDNNGCIGSDTLSFEFYPPPAVDLGDDRFECASDPLRLSGGLGDSYLWSTGEGSQEIFVSQSGVYSLEITRYGCSSTDTVEVGIIHADSLQIGEVKVQDISCFGAQNGRIEVKATGMGNSYLFSIDGGMTYHDNGGGFGMLAPGDNYQVAVMEDSICFRSYDVALEISEPEEISYDFHMASPSCDVCYDGTIILKNLQGGSPPYTIQWSTLDTGSQLSGLAMGNYGVTITDAQNCTDQTLVFLDMGFKIPNAFTPNGDGVNDRFEIKLLRSYSEAVLTVFNMDGQKVFESAPGYPEPWDGNYNGKPLPTGSYYYILLVNENLKPFSGSITLIR